ncbi:MAG: exodeoxyribonuclease VII large subunit [Bacteroidota bacterium]
MQERLTLYELNTGIRDALQDAFPGTCWVVAEISELKENRSGHCYLELIEKDEFSDEIIARARATIWSYTWRLLRSYFETTTGQAFRHGLKVLVQASVEFHPSYGLSLNIKDLDPTYTLGDLAMRRREIIRRLEDTGVLNMNKELPLPLVPQRIAVISSATAAGYQDFVKHLDENPYGFRFFYELFEAYMQGSETVPSVLKALDRIYGRAEEFDAVVIIRGGGATIDLSSFDHFDLAYVVAQFPLPVITGIGHEKDDTIIDLVAHTRLKTPTAVAGFFISGAQRFFEMLNEKRMHLDELVRERLDAEQERLIDLATGLSDSVEKYLQGEQNRIRKAGQRLMQGVTRDTFRRREALSRLRFRLSQKLQGDNQVRRSVLRQMAYRLKISSLRYLGKSESRLAGYGETLPKLALLRLSHSSGKIKDLEEKLRLLDPQQVLKRGYTLTSQNGKIIASVADLRDDLNLETRFADGCAISKITKKEKYGND